MPLEKPPPYLQRTDSVTNMIGRAWSVAASTTAQSGDKRVRPVSRGRVQSELSANSEKSSLGRVAEFSVRDGTPQSPFLGGNRRHISRAKRKSALTKMRSMHTISSAVTKSSSRARLSAGQVQLARHPGLSKSLLVTQEASPLAMAKERIGERMASRAFEMRNAAEHAEAQLFGVNKLQREDSISTSIVKVADMESAARHYYDLTCLFSLSGIIFAMLELEFLHWNYNEANTWTMAFKSMVTGLTMLSLLVLTKYHYLKFEILKARRLIPPDESFVYSNSIFIWLFEMVVLGFHIPPFLDFQIAVPLDVNYRDGAYIMSHVDTWSILIVVRFYLVVRLLMHHSTLVSNKASLFFRMNNMELDWLFTMKLYMYQTPMQTLVYAFLFFLFLFTYLFRVCEREVQPFMDDFFNSVWLQFVSVTTVGYGDLYPQTTCGRMISMASIVFGMFLTALLFSTTAKVLILNRMENTVVDMLTREEWVKAYEDCAARCIVATWRWYRKRKQEYLKKLARKKRGGLNARIASLKEAEKRITTFGADIADAAAEFQDARAFYFEVNRFRSIRREMQKAHIPDMNEIIAEHVLEVKAVVDEIIVEQQELMDEHRRMRVVLRRIAEAVEKIAKGSDATGSMETPGRMLTPIKSDLDNGCDNDDRKLPVRRRMAGNANEDTVDVGQLVSLSEGSKVSESEGEKVVS